VIFFYKRNRFIKHDFKFQTNSEIEIRVLNHHCFIKHQCLLLIKKWSARKQWQAW